jgi:uncharacterized protein (TIGR03437 family)
MVPAGESEDGLRRTYPKPLPINVKFRGEEEDGESEEPLEEEQTIAVVNSASYSGDAIAPLQIVSIFGFVGPDKFEPAIIEGGQITDYLADVQVLFDGTASPILFVSNGQANVIVPSDVAGKSTVTVTVTYQGTIWEIPDVPVEDSAPEIFSMNGLGHGLAAAIDADGQPLSEENLVAPGDVITFFGTGVGLWKDGFIDGTIVEPENLPEPKKPVEIKIGGAVADTLYIGGAPGMPNAVVQFNAVIPEVMPEIDDSTDPWTARIELTSGGHPSKADIFIYVAPTS